jgi:hypothetical protein
MPQFASIFYVVVYEERIVEHFKGHGGLPSLRLRTTKSTAGRET